MTGTFKVTPKTEEEVSQRKLWEKGTYSFEILEFVKFGSKEIKTAATTSSKGDPMLVLVVKVYNDDGSEQVVVDYLTAHAEYKIRHAAVACGLLEQYNAGALDPVAFVGKTGWVKLGVSKGKAKPDGDGNYPDKNSINDYVVEEAPAASANGAAHVGGGGATTPIADDSIPFATSHGMF
jgi:hypothetical protein